MLNERNTLLEDDGIEEEILVEEECSVAQAVWGDIQGNIENQTDLQNALDAKQDSLTEAQLSAVNSGITSEKVTTYDGYADQIASKADQSALNAESTARGEADTALGTRIDNEVLARQQADNGLQSQIDAITSKSDVVDVVANYAALQAYDTSTLGNNDVVKVLDDETHEDALTYYRWSTTTQTWTYIGQEAPYYSKGQMDVKLAEKQDKLTAGANIQIQNGTISATDTKYTNGNGLNLNGTEFSADTDVLATKEDLEGYYTKPETDTKLAPKLEAEVVAELPTTGAEGKLYLTPKAHTTSTATGNPIEATITAQAGQLESFQLDGDTFQQSYTGKNLLNIKDNLRASDSGLDFSYANNELNVNGTTTRTWANVTKNISVSLPAGKYTLSLSKQLTYRVYLHIVYTDSTSSDSFIINAGQTRTTITLAKDTSTIRLDFSMMDIGVTIDESFSIQLEAGETATPYEPYVGGQPSPSPDFPQPIQTVTGEQTISINGTNYPLDLGSIELCKLGTYQDYIWKDGEDWKVHKDIGKYQFNGSEPWVRSGSTTSDVFVAVIASALQNYLKVKDRTTLKSPYFIQNSRISKSSGQMDAYNGSDTAPASFALSFDATTITNITDATTWISNNKPTVYSVINNPTDTTITDTTLIAQLEAIRTASLQNGANTITNTATGSNLAGDMEISYYEYDPTNRYDKWLWLRANNAYEEFNEEGGGGGGGGSITVDSALSTTSKNPVQNKVVTAAINSKVDSSSLATVATSGSYNDLLNKPTIPAAQVNSDWNAASGVAQILNKPTLATVATSGSYTDLTDKPTIPATNNINSADWSALWQ